MTEAKDDEKIIVVMPAFNAEKTLRRTYEDLPSDLVGAVILVDDGSKDHTVTIAEDLGLKVFVHNKNYGYGANQKTCYTEALKAGATIVVMVHPDYQYDPKLLPQMIGPIQQATADVVLGSRMAGVSAYKQGMPWWKYLANRFLTWVENQAFGLSLSEYHTGYRAYARGVLERTDFLMNSDAFIFDQEIIAQILEAGFKIAEIPVPVRYFPEASSAGFLDSTYYGLQILWLIFRYLLHKRGIWEQRRFTSHASRYTIGRTTIRR
ncbi:MAG: glycosyltransferase family 2 protein [Chloroflexi bacterium]|nr:glycosyltransferase family 2 protein [Chloroflexota bacterium]